jgi:hypothetical protein
MNDNPIRKTLSLKKKRIQNKHKQLEIQELPHSSKDQYQGVNSNKNRDLSQNSEIINRSPEIAKLQESRKIVLAQLEQLEQRIIFTSSEPLKDTCNNLKRKDIEILCEINECLLKL